VGRDHRIFSCRCVGELPDLIELFLRTFVETEEIYGNYNENSFR
jgi:hypothetical protein